MGILVREELKWAVREAFHPAKMLAATLAAIGFGLLLGPNTPGAVLGAGWRLAGSVLFGFFALAIAHAMLRRRARVGAEPLREALRVTIAAVILLLAGVFVLSYLLATVAGGGVAEVRSPLTVSLPVDGPLLLASALLLIGVVTAAAGRRMQVPGALVFLAIGMLVADDGLALVRLDDPQLVQSIGIVALVIVLFDGGLNTTTGQLRKGLGPGLALATVGVGITAGVTALGAMALLDVSSRVAWLIGAVAASTDATAVFAVLRRVGLPERLSAILRIESGANDPVAVLLTVGLLSAWDAPPSAGTWLAFGAAQLVGGFLVGALVGELGALLIRRLRLEASGLYPIIGLAIAGITYGAAAGVGASGFLAVFIAGAVLAGEVPRRRVAISSFVSTLAGGVEIGLFLLLGLLVFPSDLPAVAGVSIAVAVILMVLARPLAVAVSLAWFDTSVREAAVVAWLGMRGAVPIVLATLAFSAGISEASLVFDVVFFVVLLSTLVQGLTASYVVDRLDLATAPTDPVSPLEILPLDSMGLDVIEVEIVEGSPLADRPLAEADPPGGVLVIAVRRNERTLVPGGQTTLLAGDRLVAATTDRSSGAARVQRWVARVTSAPEDIADSTR